MDPRSGVGGVGAGEGRGEGDSVRGVMIFKKRKEGRGLSLESFITQTSKAGKVG